MATDRNRNRNDRHPNAPEPSPEPTALGVPDQAGSLVTRVTDEAQAAALFSGDGIEMAPIFVRLAEGDFIQGIFERKGRVRAEDERDRITGEIREKWIGTIVLRRGAVLVEFNSAHEIDRALADLGKDDRGRVELRVLRGPDERIPGGTVVTRYRVATRRL